MSDELRTKLLQTANLRQEQLTELRRLMPNLFMQNGNLNTAEFEKFVKQQASKTNEFFEFKWFGKNDAKHLAYSPINKTLKYTERKSVNPQTADGNLIIEGDNLEVMKCLLASYRAKIKCIYIDPPYNTGGSDFLYNDNFTEKEAEHHINSGNKDEQGNRLTTNPQTSGRFHSKWLNMMYPRLVIARQLLKNDGVICISIDDIEQAHLKVVCDEIFGRENFVATIPRKIRSGKADVPYGLSQNFDWLLIYMKNADKNQRLFKRKMNRKYYYTPEEFGDDCKYGWRLNPLTTHRTTAERHNSDFTIVNPKNGEKFPVNPNAVWRITKDSFPQYLKENKIVFPGDYPDLFPKMTVPMLRKFKYEDADTASVNSNDFIDYVTSNECTTGKGTKEIQNDFNCKLFSFPKPVGLIKKLLEYITTKDDIILDFFAGSGTTGKAVIELNGGGVIANSF